jgi:hypothetical protein
MVQHSFDIDLSRPDCCVTDTPPAAVIPSHNVVDHHDGDHDTALTKAVHHHDVRLARPPRPRTHAGMHSHTGWLAEFPERLAKLEQARAAEANVTERWTFDLDRWKATDGVDELAFLWNNLPDTSTVDVYLPGLPVVEVVNYRNLRHSPRTVEIVDAHTLRLQVGGPAYMPIPTQWGDHVAGHITITLPPGITNGQEFTVDVVQLRSATRTVLGGFRLAIYVHHAAELVEPTRRELERFHRRLALTPRRDRWWPVLAREVELARERAQGMLELADPNATWHDPIAGRCGLPARVVIERIEMLEDHDPWLKGAGEIRFVATVRSPDGTGHEQSTRLPAQGIWEICDRPGANIVELDVEAFSGFVERHLSIEVCGVEEDTFDPDDRLGPYRRTFTGDPTDWYGGYGPEDAGDWRLWYRIEP